MCLFDVDLTGALDTHLYGPRRSCCRWSDLLQAARMSRVRLDCRAVVYIQYICDKSEWCDQPTHGFLAVWPIHITIIAMSLSLSLMMYAFYEL